ncbi:MAG TPA: hypothetical protein VH560_17300 [Polyangia bacterium]|nr:hypothetical protein [Polyangia bacterium]
MFWARTAACTGAFVLAVSAAASGFADDGGAPTAARATRGRRDAANTPTALSRGNVGAPSPRAPRAAPAPPATEPMHVPEGTGVCKKVPSGKRVVRLRLKPDADLGDLVAWISSVTCKSFLVPGTIPANSKKVTLVAPNVMTPEEAYIVFLNALDSVGLTVEPSDWFFRIIETSTAKSHAIPFYPDPRRP